MKKYSALVIFFTIMGAYAYPPESQPTPPFAEFSTMGYRGENVLKNFAQASREKSLKNTLFSCATAACSLPIARLLGNSLFSVTVKRSPTLTSIHAGNTNLLASVAIAAGVGVLTHAMISDNRVFSPTRKS